MQSSQLFDVYRYSSRMYKYRLETAGEFQQNLQIRYLMLKSASYI